MHDRLDDLFILDAEQAARELLIYGEGRSELPIDRLSGTTEYLAPLLQSCGLLRHADACMLFADLFEVADEGQIKRLVREFSELLIQSLDALKAGTTISELGENAALEQLFGRLQQFSPSSSQAERAPYPSRFRQVDSHPADPDRELIANAFRAIEAVDSLAVMIAQEAQGQATPSGNSQSPLDPGPTTVTDLGFNPNADSVADSGILPKIRSGPSDIQHSIEPSDKHALDSEAAENFDFGERLPPQQHQATTEGPKQSPLPPTTIYSEANTEAALSAVVDTSQSQAATLPAWNDLGDSIEVMRRSAISSVEIDAAFRKALRLAQEGPWAQGMTALLESIDVLDHVALRQVLPPQLHLLGSHQVLVQPRLAFMLGQELNQARVTGVGDAMLVSQTLILALQLDRLIPPDRVAKQLALRGGRIEVDTGLKRWRIVVPASARLLRVTQLLVEGSWLAVPWAQFLGVEGKAGRQEAQLCIGNEPDKIRIDALGLLSTGVHFELARAIRRRERYSGLVMLSNSDCLPIYA